MASKSNPTPHIWCFKHAQTSNFPLKCPKLQLSWVIAKISNICIFQAICPKNCQMPKTPKQPHLK